MGVVTLLVGAYALGTGWTGWTARGVLAAAVLGPYLLLLLVGRRTPLAAPGIMSVVVLGAGLAAGPPADLSATLRDSIPSLLTAARPAPATAALLLPGILLGGLVGTWVGTRACRPGGGTVAPTVGAAVLYLAGALLSAGRADRHGILAATLVLCAAVGWLVADRRSPSSRGGIARALPVSVLGTAVVAVLVAMVPANAGFEPRELVTPPPEPLVEPNPLPRLPALAERDDEEMFRYTGSGIRLHLVSMVDFNGSSWQARTQYRPVGALAASLLTPGSQRQEVVTNVAIGALDGLWLPAPGDPTSVSLMDAKVDADSGSLVLPGGLRTGLRYEVRSLVDTPVEANLAVAPVPYAAPYVGVPKLPYLFAEYLQRIVSGASTPFEQAVLIEAAVRENRRVAVNAPPGSSYARLLTFLFGQSGDPGAQVGTSEQFATAFAILARTAGLPTRLVVGFRPGVQDPDGTWVVRGRDATAWPEVYFTGQGWVPFDPTPPTTGQVDPTDDARRQILDRVGQNPPPPPRRAPAVPAAIPTPAPTAPSGAPAAARGPFGLASYVDALGLVTLGLVAAILLVLLVGRSFRRVRHRRAGPRGAWSEVLDMLLLLGRSPAPWHTAPRIALDLAVAVPVAGEHPALRLAAYADRATFAPPGVSVQAPWAELGRLRAAVRRTVPWYRRTTWPIDPRPLLRRGGKAGS